VARLRFNLVPNIRQIFLEETPCSDEHFDRFFSFMPMEGKQQNQLNIKKARK